MGTDFQNSFTAIFVRQLSKYLPKDIHNTLIMLPHYRAKRLTIVGSHQRGQTRRNSWMEA